MKTILPETSRAKGDDVRQEQVVKKQKEYKMVGKMRKTHGHEFKPFDKVLVRDCDYREWCADFYSHFGDNGLYICVSGGWSQCIPYEGNQDLIGTTNKPKEE